MMGYGTAIVAVFEIFALSIAGVLGGRWLDGKFGLEFPLATIGLALGGLSVAFYRLYTKYKN